MNSLFKATTTSCFVVVTFLFAMLKPSSPCLCQAFFQVHAPRMVLGWFSKKCPPKSLGQCVEVKVHTYPEGLVKWPWSYNSGKTSVSIHKFLQLGPQCVARLDFFPFWMFFFRQTFISWFYSIGSNHYWEGLVQLSLWKKISTWGGTFFPLGEVSLAFLLSKQMESLYGIAQQRTG